MSFDPGYDKLAELEFLLAHPEQINRDPRREQIEAIIKRSELEMASLTGRQEKDASVVGRSVVGGIIAGPLGAVIGGMSAVDKNNRNRNKN